ncbi:hypothetical protein J4233_05130 [Candidatus Pacearchaeota archaeon]|nr:hypothetical protein [Candidatus Pacearchaeota archaeon]
MENRQWVMNVLVLLTVIEVVLIGFSSYKTATSTEGFCVVGQANGGCDSVQSSVYSAFLGVKLSYMGLFSFLVLLVVLIRDIRKKRISDLFVGFALVGFLFSSYLIYIQLFVLKQICTTCMMADGIAILIFFVSLIARKKAPLVYR